jgi:hypothetical protein
MLVKVFVFSALPIRSNGKLAFLSLSLSLSYLFRPSKKCLIITFVFSDHASFCALVDGDGEVVDHIRLVHLTKRKNSTRNDEGRLKVWWQFLKFCKM